MKRILVTLSLLIILPATAARAETYVEVRGERSHGPNMLLINPGDLFSGIVSREYERALASWFGISVGLSVLSFRGVFTPSGDPTFIALGPELGARFHFIRDAPGGLWLGPTVSAGYLISRSDGAVASALSWGLGAAIGYNFIFGHHFTFQIGGGGGFVDYGDRLVWSPRLRLGLGAVF